jgi:hypothetical protein
MERREIFWPVETEELAQKEEAPPEFWERKLNLRSERTFSFWWHACFAYNVTIG